MSIRSILYSTLSSGALCITSATAVVACESSIKVGVLHSLSGSMAISETTLKDAMLMLIEQQNASGGLLGCELEAVVVDPASDWPLFDIWQFNMIEGAAKPRAIKQSVLITRAAFDPQPHPLEPAQAAWIAAIDDGATVESAQDAALFSDAAFDLAPLLGLLLQQGAVVKITSSKD